jgi:hypothetical protein
MRQRVSCANLAIAMAEGLYKIMSTSSEFLSVEINGPCFRAFSETLGQDPYGISNSEDQQRIVEGSINAASLFLPHFSGSNHPRTSLLVGNVQSGKTTSIRGILCLAADSNVPIIVLMTGTKRVLYNQTLHEMTSFINNYCQRSIKHLDIGRSNTNSDPIIQSILRTISIFYSESEEIRSRRQSLFIPILKKPSNIERLIQLLAPLCNQRVDNFVIIDDEGDEFSLNTTANTPNSQGSACYNACRNLRSLLPCTTNYLQVTATPQGPLLISRDDPLSPEYASLSEPGIDYSGGEDYFPPRENNHPLILSVPDIERPNIWAADPLLRHQIPQTLKQAFHYFLAAGSFLLAKNTLKYVTMLIHPATGHPIHNQYQDYILRLLNDYLGLQEQDQDQFKSDIFLALHDYFQRLGCLDEINSSPELKDRIYSKILDILIYNEVRLINSESQLPVDAGFWGVKFAYFILGAQCIARGFVVKNLITTYLPRDTNPTNPNAFLGQIDTIQQQARFFGYKKSYLKYCRVFLRPRIHTQFSEYVIHEGVMRNVISQNYQTRNPYSGIQLPIPVQFRPTRRNILRQQFPIATFGNAWNLERFPHILDVQSLKIRQQLFSDLILRCFDQQLPTDRVPSSDTSFTVSDLLDFLECLISVDYPVIDRPWITTTISMLRYLIDKSARGYDANRPVRVYLFPYSRKGYPATPPLMSTQSLIDPQFIRQRLEVNDFASRGRLDQYELNPHGGAANDRDSRYFDSRNPSIHLFHIAYPHYSSLLKRLSELGETPQAERIASFSNTVSSNRHLTASSLSCTELENGVMVPVIPSFGLRLPDLISTISL